MEKVKKEGIKEQVSEVRNQEESMILNKGREKRKEITYKERSQEKKKKTAIGFEFKILVSVF